LPLSFFPLSLMAASPFMHTSFLEMSQTSGTRPRRELRCSSLRRGCTIARLPPTLSRYCSTGRYWFPASHNQNSRKFKCLYYIAFFRFTPEVRFLENKISPLTLTLRQGLYYVRGKCVYC
jgi:hypothetical protein